MIYNDHDTRTQMVDNVYFLSGATSSLTHVYAGFQMEQGI